MKFEALTDDVLDCFYDVYGELGYGFRENIYQTALSLKLKERGILHKTESPIKVRFMNQKIGEYFADLVVEDSVILELKAVESLTENHEAQLLNYLNATTYEVGLLLNFGPNPEISRKVYDNSRKNYDPPS